MQTAPTDARNYDHNRKRYRVLVAVACATLASACGSNAESGVGTPDPLVTVALSPEASRVNVGDSVTLAVNISGGNATTPPTLRRCTSGDTSIAHVAVVNGACVGVGVHEGATTIIAESSTGQLDSTRVTVFKGPPAIY